MTQKAQRYSIFLGHCCIANQLLPLHNAKNLVERYAAMGRKTYSLIFHLMWNLWTYYWVHSLDQLLKLISKCRWPRILISSGSMASYLFEAEFPAPEFYHQKIWCGQQIVNKVMSALSSSGAAGWRPLTQVIHWVGLRTTLYTSYPVISYTWFTTFFKFCTQISPPGGDCLIVSSLLQTLPIAQAIQQGWPARSLGSRILEVVWDVATY